MPACRGVWLTHPISGTVGLWMELSTSASGVLTGQARTSWPSTTGKNLTQYQTELNTLYRTLCALPAVTSGPFFGVAPPGYFIGIDGKLYPKVVDVIITLSSLVPVTISEVTVNEGAVRQRGV